VDVDVAKMTRMAKTAVPAKMPPALATGPISKGKRKKDNRANNDRRAKGSSQDLETKVWRML